ncbi:sorting nexin-8 [Aplochiton taeniatus]
MQASGWSPLVADPLVLQHLMDRDYVQVQLLQEKKGLPFLKHLEYEVTTKRFKLPVNRRYSDFDLLHELLLERFTYRMVPRLPPKRMLKEEAGVVYRDADLLCVPVLNSERESIDCRRRGLERFVALVTQHPVLGRDEMVQIFLCASGADVQQKLKQSCKKRGDEFMTNPISGQAKEYLPSDIHIQVTIGRDFIGNILSSFQRLRDRVDLSAQRSHDHAADLLLMSKELRCPDQGGKVEEEVMEKLSLLLDMLQSFKDLCERQEKGVLVEHKKALQKPSTSRGQNASTTIPTLTLAKVTRPAQQGSRLTQQENAIVTMELRNYFAMLCVHQETQLILRHLPLTTHILACFIQAQAHGHTEMGDGWSELAPTLTGLRETSSRQGSVHSAMSTPRLPLAGPMASPNLPRPPFSPMLRPFSPRSSTSSAH